MSRSSSQEQEQSSRPKHPSPSVSVFLSCGPLLPYPAPLVTPSSLTYMYTLADARTCQCDQFTLETLTKIKFQVHRLPAHAEAYSAPTYREERTSRADVAAAGTGVRLIFPVEQFPRGCLKVGGDVRRVFQAKFHVAVIRCEVLPRCNVNRVHGCYIDRYIFIVGVSCWETTPSSYEIGIRVCTDIRDSRITGNLICKWRTRKTAANPEDCNAAII